MNNLRSINLNSKHQILEKYKRFVLDIILPDLVRLGILKK